MGVWMVEGVERLVWLNSELELKAGSLVREGDRQPVRGLMPEEANLYAVVLSVGELLNRLSRGDRACHGRSFRQDSSL